MRGVAAKHCVGAAGALVGQRLVAVQIAHAHIERVLAQVARDVAQNGLDHHHALGPAKAAKRGVALGIGFAAVRSYGYVFQKVGVVAVKHRAVGHRARQVGAKAAVGRHHQFQRGEPPRGVKTGCVFVGKGVALAGDHEVVVAVQAQLDRRFELVCGDCRPHRHVPGLGFLAAKAAAHAPAFHPHRVVVQAQRVRHPVLHFARVLGAAVNRPLALRVRHGVGHLALQVKVLLPAHL